MNKDEATPPETFHTALKPSPELRGDGLMLTGMFDTALALLELNVEEVNRLNVFPVPDGDTGVNMFLTLSEIVTQANRIESTSVAEVSKVMSETALIAARGNSGVILSQLFKGFADHFEFLEEMRPRDLAEAFAPAAVAAYAATSHPREGTILTVIREVSEITIDLQSASFPKVLGAICDTALDTVSRTPSMLPILWEAGVVDAGGYGLYLIFEGMRMYVSGLELKTMAFTPPSPSNRGGSMSESFLDSIESENYGYCIQFVVHGEEMDLQEIKRRISELGKSGVVIGSPNLVRIHIHALEPDPVIKYGRCIGEVEQLQIQNMDTQRDDYGNQRRSEFTGDDRKQVSVVAVAVGTGIEKVFREYGVTEIINGGDSLNPSVGQILNAVEDVPTSDVLILPNNPNIITTAQQAASLTSKNLSVVPASTIPEGIEAINQFDASRSLESNLTEMCTSLEQLSTLEVCRAVRPAELRGIKVGENQIIGLLNHQLIASGDTEDVVLVDALTQVITGETELVTLFWGGPMTQDGASDMIQLLESRFTDVDFESYHGGQPYYHFLVSIQ